MRLGVVADDLTGANDTGVQFARRGARTLVPLDCHDLRSLARRADVLVLNTNSRAVAPRVAVQKGTVGSFGNIEKGDILDGVDGQGVRSLEDLYERLDRSKGRDRIPLRLKRFADTPVDWVFEYIEQAVKVEDLRWISQETQY